MIETGILIPMHEEESTNRFRSFSLSKTDGKVVYYQSQCFALFSMRTPGNSADLQIIRLALDKITRKNLANK